MDVIPTRPANNAAGTPKVDYCFDLKLGESNVETYPEFSWKELVKEAQAQKLSAASAEGKNTLDPYASDDEDDLRALAAKFEKKYNNDGGTGKGKRRKRKAEDYIDRGAGYDETDSFIDNSEVYDELVPEDMQPVHGGFYINSGRLDFKDADVSDCDVDEEIEEQLLTSGRKFSKSVVKKGLPQAKTNKKKRASDKDEGGKSGRGNGSIASKKASESPKRSASSSPVRSSGKTKTITISSDSSSSDSSGSSSSSSSDSEKDGDSSATARGSATTGNTSTAVSTEKLPVPSNNQLPRRLKVKNVPLNPKLHGDSPPTLSVQQVGGNPTPKPPSNQTIREIYGSLLPSTSGSSTAPVLSTTMLPSTSRPGPSSLTQPKSSSEASPKSYAVPSPVPVPKPKMRKRVTDRLSVPGNLVRKPSVTNLSPSIASPLKKKQKLNALPATTPPQPGTVAKKPRKPRVSNVRTPPTPVLPSTTAQRPLTTEEQHRMILQHFQRHPQMTSLGLGLFPHLTPATVPTLPATPSPKERRPAQQTKSTTAADVLKNLASFQTQVGSGVTVSEVKKTKVHALSPSGSMATISPKSSTPPSRLSSPSPINIPRIPIPSSITVTASNPRSQQHQHQRSSNNSSVASPPTGSPNIQPVQNSSKTFTDFHMNALLSKPFINSNSSSTK